MYKNSVEVHSMPASGKITCMPQLGRTHQIIVHAERGHLSHLMTKPTKCEDSDQPGHLPSLISIFAVRMKKAWVLNYSFSTQRRLWSDWVDAHADLRLCWVHIIILLVLLCGGSFRIKTKNGVMAAVIIAATQSWVDIKLAKSVEHEI